MDIDLADAHHSRGMISPPIDRSRNIYRAILAVVLGAGFLANLRYLTHNCPIDLAGDEAQYWDWSRRLDLCYYSKGPLVAYIIRGSCAIFGDTMPAVRFPALLLGLGTALTGYFLTRRLFRSEKLALANVLLSALVPLFIAGSLLMTIDAPMFLCWALATYFAAVALFDDREKKWPWIAVGLAIGIGALAKYGILLWFVGLLGFLAIDPRGRRWLRSIWPWVSLVIALVCLTPCAIWNARHGWVSLLHVASATGAKSGSSGNTIEFILSQLGVLGPTLAVITIAAVVYAIRAKGDPFRREMIFLATIGLTFFAINFIDSFFAKTQVNWPAPAYFSLTILATYFLSVRWHKRLWRVLLYLTVIVGVATIITTRNDTLLMDALKPIAAKINGDRPKPLLDLTRLDPMERVRGWHLLGDAVSRERDKLGDAFILCDDYQQTAECAFYSRGRPITYCAGPYFGKRLSQYDMWPDRRLHDNPDLLGRNAVYVGKGGFVPKEVEAVFARVERGERIPIVVAGVEVKSFKLWRCYGFKGFGPLVVKDH